MLRVDGDQRPVGEILGRRRLAKVALGLICKTKREAARVRRRIRVEWIQRVDQAEQVHLDHDLVLFVEVGLPAVVGREGASAEILQRKGTFLPWMREGIIPANEDEPIASFHGAPSQDELVSLVVENQVLRRPRCVQIDGGRWRRRS